MINLKGIFKCILICFFLIIGLSIVACSPTVITVTQPTPITQTVTTTATPTAIPTSSTTQTQTATMTTSQTQTTGSATTKIELMYDDGLADGSSSAGGYAFRVQFSPPAKPFTITQIKMYTVLRGSGYESQQVGIKILSKQLVLLYSTQKPATEFTVNNPTWATIGIPNIVVNDDFYVYMYPNAPKEGGVYLHYDTSTTNLHSEFIAPSGDVAPWSLYSSKDKTNWMIRVVGESPSITTTNTSQTTTATPTKTAIEDAIDVSYDPNPVPVAAGQPVYWKMTLTETKGIGITIKSTTRQLYTSSGPMGTPSVFNSTQWFQNLPGTYLPPYGKGIIGAGYSSLGSSIPDGLYAIDTITGTNDKGQDIVAKGKVNFIQTTTTTTTTSVTPTATQNQTAKQDAIVVSFNPDPVPIDPVHTYWSVIIKETKGVGITLNTFSQQFYTQSGSIGSPIVYNTKDWFQSWLPNAYLPPLGQASMKCGFGTIIYGNTPVTPSYCVFTFKGTDDKGQDIVAVGRVNFTQ